MGAHSKSDRVYKNPRFPCNSRLASIFQILLQGKVGYCKVQHSSHVYQPGVQFIHSVLHWLHTNRGADHDYLTSSLK